MSDIRKDFEDWFITFDITPVLSDLDKDDEGYYIDSTTQRMWQAYQAAAERYQPKWIEVEDGDLVGGGSEVAIHWSGTDEVEIDYMDVDADTGCYYWANNSQHPPTHWMPLPAPPEVKE